MPRPLYEKESDQKAEVRLGQTLGSFLKAEFVRIQGRDGKPHLDGAYIRDGAIMAFSENKQRTYVYRAYPDYCIGERKVLDARTVTEIFRVPVFLVVGFRCGTVASLNFQRPYRQVVSFGRHDRGDPFDTEPGAGFAWKEFRIVKHP